MVFLRNIRTHNKRNYPTRELLDHTWYTDLLNGPQGSCIWWNLRSLFVWTSKRKGIWSALDSLLLYLQRKENLWSLSWWLDFLKLTFEFFKSYKLNSLLKPYGRFKRSKSGQNLCLDISLCSILTIHLDIQRSPNHLYVHFEVSLSISANNWNFIKPLPYYHLRMWSLGNNRQSSKEFQTMLNNLHHLNFIGSEGVNHGNLR